MEAATINDRALNVTANVRKRLFISLLSLSLFCTAGLVVALWYLALSPTRSLFQQAVFLSLAALLVGTMALSAFGVGGMVLTIWSARSFLLFEAPMRVAVNLLFPLALFFGRLLGQDTAKIKQSFIAVNNHLVRSRSLKVLPEKLLVLLPHCLQRSACPHKITIDIGNCRRCGKCPVAGLIALKEKYGINIGMASGGTLARRYVQMYRPRAIVAVACERDLTSGIQDTNPIPVLGVPNERPHGPCMDTSVRQERVEEAIRFFLEG